MTKLDQYLANAQHCGELLRVTRNPRHRVYLLEMLAAWEMLARAQEAKHDLAQGAKTTGGEAPCPAA